MKIEYNLRGNKGNAILILLILFTILVALFYDKIIFISTKIICNTNKNKVYTAVQNHNESAASSDVNIKLKSVDMNKLIEGGHLRKKITCSLGGLFYYDENGDFHCSVHGKYK